MTITTGTRLGPYEVIEPLGMGGMGVSPDGKRFLAIVPKIVADELPLDVTVNWTAEVGK